MALLKKKEKPFAGYFSNMVLFLKIIIMLSEIFSAAMKYPG